MKILLITSYLIYLSGFFLKFFHVPRNAIIMMAGIALMLLVYSIAGLTKKFDRSYVIAGFATTTWLVLLLFTVKFWPFTIPILSFAAAVTIASILYSYKLKKFNEIKLIFISIILCLTFYFMPTDTKYYLISIKWNQEIETDYYSWDKYSWFLYQNGRFDAALKASNRALELANKNRDINWTESITDHNRLIKNRKWSQYH